jgi:hypothetical protein
MSYSLCARERGRRSSPFGELQLRDDGELRWPRRAQERERYKILFISNSS